MKAARLKYAIITKKRPTKFLTQRGELTDDFEEAILFYPDEVENALSTLDDPNDFEIVKVFITTEV